VSQKLISNAVRELRESGKLSTHTELSTEGKRDQVREYVEANPTASDREVAREVDCGVSHPTVGNWRDEWESGETPADNTADAAQPASEPSTAGDAQARQDLSDGTDRGAADESAADVGLFTSDETDEWSSPRELVEPLNDAVGGFDLDPCSGAERSPFAAETYTEADDGLSQPWRGTVWVNPPYSEMADWTAKAVAEAERDAVDAIYYLCKGDSSTDWWHDALGAASVVAVIDHRLSFGDGGNSAPFASHIFVFGTPDQTVLTELNRHGAVLTDLHVGGGSDE
jgi:phage N-6-adenine-methyltransferase